MSDVQQKLNDAFLQAARENATAGDGFSKCATLLAQGADIDALNEKGETALVEAYQRGDVFNTFFALMKHNASALVPDADGQPLVVTIFKNKHVGILSFCFLMYESETGDRGSYKNLIPLTQEIAEQLLPETVKMSPIVFNWFAHQTQNMSFNKEVQDGVMHQAMEADNYLVMHYLHQKGSEHSVEYIIDRIRRSNSVQDTETIKNITRLLPDSQEHATELFKESVYKQHFPLIDFYARLGGMPEESFMAEHISRGATPNEQKISSILKKMSESSQTGVAPVSNSDLAARSGTIHPAFVTFRSDGSHH